MKTFTSIRKKDGFTLVELLVVIFIIGLLAGIVGPQIMGKTEKAKIAKTQAQMIHVEQALDQFYLDTGRYPTTQEGIQALITNPGIEGWDGNYLTKQKMPTDGWNRPFQYQSPGTHGDYDITSYGKDGTPGGEGENADVVSWE